MLSFAHPEWLPLLLLAPLIAWRRAHTPRPALILPRAAKLPAAGRHIDRADAYGRAVIIALLVLAAAGPRTPDARTRLPTQGIAMALVIDVSGSMATPDFSGQSRIAAAKSAFEAFIDRRETDAIALVSFAATPRTECPPTLNHTVLRSLVDKLEPRTGIDAGTNIGDAIAEALLRLQASPATRKAIILLSDGEHNATGSGADTPLTPRQAAQLAANLNVPLYTIDCGGPGSDAESIKQRDAGRAILKASAELTGGRAFLADNAEQLQSVMAEIDALQRTTIESYQYRRYFDHGWILALAALGLWLVLSLIEATLWRTLP